MYSQAKKIFKLNKANTEKKNKLNSCCICQANYQKYVVCLCFSNHHANNYLAQIDLCWMGYLHYDRQMNLS